MKHTEGEWQTSKMSGGDVEIWAFGTPKIAMVHMTNVSINEHKANVKLIAAAPELLEALKKMEETAIALADTVPAEFKMLRNDLFADVHNAHLYAREIIDKIETE